MTSQLERECDKAPRVTAEFAYGQAKGNGWDHAAHNWRVTLRHEGRRLSVDFFGGEAVTNPTAADVLSSLMLDASIGEESFQDFCDDLGYDEDSRKAELTWKACAMQAPKVRRLLGSSWERFARCEH